MMLLLRLLIVAVVGWLAYGWYGLVLPEAGATVMAVIIAGAALYALIAANLKFSLALAGGAVIFSWPAGALIAQAVAHALGQAELPHTLALALAWPVPVIAEKVGYRLADKGDKTRHFGGLALGAIALYTALAAAWASNRYGMAAAAFGAAVIAANAAQQLVISPPQKRAIYTAAKVGWLAAIALLLRAVTGV